MLDIKEDQVEFRTLLECLQQELQVEKRSSPRQLAERLSQLRDALETYFALEEFYGCFELAANGDPNNASIVRKLERQHRDLYALLDSLVDRAEQIVYRETHSTSTVDVVQGFAQFCQQLQAHEEFELDLISRQSALQIGVGD
jgi:iron-sulfur cluster repair protein YtfE (RIC family)